MPEYVLDEVWREHWARLLGQQADDAVRLAELAANCCPVSPCWRRSRH